MRPITVQGIGILGAFGTGISAWASALESGMAPLSSLTVPTGKGPMELPAYRADTSALEERVPAKVLRRMDPFGRLGLLGAHLAWEDAGLEGPEREGLGLIVASGYGATTTTYALLDSIIRDGDECTSPIHFANSLHNACAANIALNLGILGPNLTVSQFDLSVPSALLTARQWLLEGRVERVLFGAVDELSELIGYLWWRRRGISTPPAVPGEGAAFFLLSRVEEERSGYCTLGEVSMGFGHDLRPSREGLLLLGADGRRELGARYAAVAEGARVACVTPLYGSLPVGPAFDLAAGALMLKRGFVYPTPGNSSLSERVAQAGALDTGRISCLGLTEQGYGWVELGL